MEKDVEWYTELLYAILLTLFPICYPYILLYSYSFTKNLTPQLSYSYLSHFFIHKSFTQWFLPLHKYLYIPEVISMQLLHVLHV